jgi:hypothetical protein
VVLRESNNRQDGDKAGVTAEKQLDEKIDVKPSDSAAAVREAASEVS